nr:unnamed protein product [Digitaria exilis]
MASSRPVQAKTKRHNAHPRRLDGAGRWFNDLDDAAAALASQSPRISDGVLIGVANRRRRNDGPQVRRCFFGAATWDKRAMSSSSNGHYPANGAKVLNTRDKNKEKVLLDRNAASSACQKDRQYIEKLETELMNCYQEIDYLQDQLNIRNVEANIMGEHIHSLELKLTELEKFPEREEIREQKLKAKEDAEDLTQEMAELRYQITGMLEEEYKRRSCIEQAAIQHIQELETQVSKEKTKLSGALRRLQESHELARKQAMEIKKLKDALERFNSVNLGTVCKSCSCGFCGMLIELSNCSIEGPSGARSPDSNHIDEKLQNQALIEWHPDEASDGDRG